MVYIPVQYPFQPPKVRCLTKVLHPNINWRTGQVYLHLLKQDWKPVLSINSVIFSLQLLFLEPWPVSAANGSSGSSSSLPPSRPILTTSSSASVSMGMNGHAPSALTLAASKSAATAAARQLEELDGILNIEIYQMILNGERGVFEDLVRRTLEGGFFFGEHFPRNKHAMNHSSDDDDDDDRNHDTDSDHQQVEHMLQRVEENGRQAHVRRLSPTSATRTHRYSQSHTMESFNDHSMMVDQSASTAAPSHSHSTTPRRPRLIHRSPTQSPSHSPHSSHHLNKILLHRKRCFHKIAHSMSSLTEFGSSAQTKRSKPSQLDDDDVELECIDPNIVAPTFAQTDALLSRPSLLSTSASTSVHSRLLRKRPSPTLSCSDGEYEDENSLQDRASSCEAKDDGASEWRRSRVKKMKPWVEGHDDDEEENQLDDAIIDRNIECFPPPVKPATHHLPDLATFAAFKPIGSPDEIVRQCLIPYGSSSSSSLPSGLSHSPKRNASDCPSVIDLPTLSSNDPAANSYLLIGRSSSRAVNFFGTVKANVLHSPTGLSDLQTMMASLPQASPMEE